MIYLMTFVCLVLDAVLLTAKDFNFVGFAMVVSFFVGYLPLLLKGAEIESLETIYLAEVLFYNLRASFGLIRWFYMIKPSLKAQNNVTETGLAPGSSRKERFIHLICCGHGMEDWDAITASLSRDDKAKANPPPEL